MKRRPTATAQEVRPPAAPATKPAAPLATVYGTLNVNFQITAARNATDAAQNVKTRNAVSTDSSNIGVRGSLIVNEYVGATYQCEISANVDGINAAGICGRNSRIGVTGNWGTLFYGNWDTPFKAVAYGTKADDPFMNTDVFGYQSIMGSPGFNYRSSAWATASDTKIAGFDVRASNSVGYHSPKWNGLSAKLQYSANEFKNASGTQSPELYGAATNWDYGPISILATYERHDDGYALAGISGTATVARPGTFGATAPNGTGSATVPISSVDTGWRVGAGYQLDSPVGATTVGATYEELDLQQGGAPAGAITEYKRGAWQVALKHRYGAHELRARYSQAASGSVTLNGGGGSTSDYGARMLAVGYAYFFASTFQAYLHYGQIFNDAKAQYTFSIGGSPAVAGSTPKGADPFALGLGLRYAF